MESMDINGDIYNQIAGKNMASSQFFLIVEICIQLCIFAYNYIYIIYIYNICIQSYVYSHAYVLCTVTLYPSFCVVNHGFSKGNGQQRLFDVEPAKKQRGRCIDFVHAFIMFVNAHMIYDT